MYQIVYIGSNFFNNMAQFVEGIRNSITHITKEFLTIYTDTPEHSEFSRIANLFQEFCSTELFSSGNQVMGNLAFGHIQTYLSKIEKALGTHKKKHKNSSKFEISISLIKLKFLVEYLKSIFSIRKDDILCLENDHERVLSLKKITKTVIIAEKPVLDQVASKFFFNLSLMKATIYKMMKYKKSPCRDLLTGWLLSYFFIFGRKKIEKLAEKFDFMSEMTSFVLLFNTTESKLMKKLIPIVLPSISTNKVIFVPRLAEFVLSDPQPNESETEGSLHYVEIISKEPILVGLRHTTTQDPGKKRVPIRILYHNNITEQIENPINKNSKKIDKIIIHVHGGAFIAMSSFSHQSYTRIWADSLKVPVFSIDYRLAPDHPFPAGFDDVWQAYN